MAVKTFRMMNNNDDVVSNATAMTDLVIFMPNKVCGEITYPFPNFHYS